MLPRDFTETFNAAVTSADWPLVIILGESAVAEQSINLLVASPAIFRGNRGRKAYFERHMGLVTVLAGLISHVFHVRFVAIETRGKIAMFGVTGRAVKSGMDRWVLLELLQLSVMAGGTGGGNGFG